MKKLISIILSAVLLLSVVTGVSAKETENNPPNATMLYAAEDKAGNGANDQWGQLGGMENDTWDNGVPKYTQPPKIFKDVEGTQSASIFTSFDNKVSFFHNFVFKDSLINKDSSGNEGKEGVDFSQYKYVEFDVASLVDVNCPSFALCLCGNVEAWHGYDAYRQNVRMKACRWYHVVMPIEEFVLATGTDDSYQYKEFGLKYCHRMRFEVYQAYYPSEGITGLPVEELCFYIDNVYATKDDEPIQPETLVYGDMPDPPVVYEKGDVNQDEKTSSADALMALQAAVNKIQLSEEQANLADVNEDGNVTSADALQILQFAVGKIKSYTKAQ